MEYTIRLAQEQDGPELARPRWDFRSEGGDEEPAVAEHEFAAAYEAFFRRGLLDQSRGHWIAEHGGRIVAHVVVQKVDMVPRPCKLHDQWGYVTDMVAAHKYDLKAAKSLGFLTAFVARPLERGPGGDVDTTPDPSFDINATSFEDLARQLSAFKRQRRIGQLG